VTPGCLVFDSSPLNYFARSNQLAVLEALAKGRDCVATQAVADELLRGATRFAQLYQVATLPWLRIVDEQSLTFLSLFSEYHRRLGGGSRNVGEATVLAYAELHGATACIDDRVAVRHGRERGVSLTGSLALVCDGLRQGILNEAGACAVVDLLVDHEAFLPCDGATFLDWARREGHLDPDR
jgi:predicted nucleic acid-binding protein